MENININVDGQNIFQTIKKMIGFEGDYDAYDIDILVQINVAFETLYQIGLEQEVDEITKETEWSDLEVESPVLSMIKNYVYMKVRHAFDPPASSSVMKAIEDQIKEMEWRLNVALDAKEEEEDE